MHATISAHADELYRRGRVDQVRIQYGGSVKARQVDELIGPARHRTGRWWAAHRLKADSFLRIVQFR